MRRLDELRDALPGATPARQDNAGGAFSASAGVAASAGGGCETQGALRLWATYLEAGWRAATDGLRLSDEEGIVRLVNGAYCQIMGRAREELEGQPLTVAYSPELAGDLVSQQRRLFAERTSPPLEELKLTLATGENRVLQVAHSLLDVAGGPPLLLSIFHDITATRRAEEETRLREARTHVLLQAAGMVTWEWDLLTDRVHYSDNIQGLLRGENVERFTHLALLLEELQEEDRPRLVAALERTRQEGCPFECEYRVRLLNGAWHWIFGQGKMVVFDGGKPVRVLGVSQDITERKQVEHALRTSDERHRRLLEILPDSCLVLDRQGRIESVNQRAVAMHACASAAELIGRPVTDLVVAEHRPRVATRRERLERGELPGLSDYTMLRADGTTFPAEVSTAPLLGAGDKLEGFITLGRDVTERRQVEAELREARDSLEKRVAERTEALAKANEALRESEAIVRAAFDHAPFEFWVRDPNGVCVMANQTCLANWGNLIGQRTEEAAIRPGTLAVWLANNQRALTGEIVQGELALPGEDGLRYVFNVVAPFRVGGEVRGIVGFNLDITARRRTEEALRESEIKYRRLHESMRDAFVRVSLDGRLLEWNRAYQEMLGYPEAQLPTLRYQDVTPERWHAMEARIVEEQILAQGHSEVYEKEYRRADGSVFPVELRAFLVRDEAGQPTDIWGIVRDITRRRRAEDAVRRLNATLEQRVQERTEALEEANAQLRATTARLQQTAQAGRVGLWDRDLRTGQIFFSAEWKQQFGYADREMPDDFSEWLGCLHPDDREPMLAEQSRRLADGSASFQIEFRLRQRDGSYRRILTQGEIVRAADGTPLRMMGSNVDITERRLALIQLAASEQRFRTLFEAAPVAMALHDAQGRYVQVNPAYSRMLAYSQGELLRRGPRAVTFPDDVPEAQRLHQELLSGGRDTYQREKRFVRRDGRTVWALSTAAAVRQAGGKLGYIISIVDDITERKRAENRAAAFSRLGLALSAATTPAEAATVIMETASALFAWDACFAAVLTQTPDRVVPVLEVDTIEGRKVCVSADRVSFAPTPLLRSVLRKGARLVNRDPAAGTITGPAPTKRFGDVTRTSASMMFAPIRSGQKAVGILSIQSYSPGAYSQTDLEVMQTLADHCGGALERVQAATARRRLEGEVIEAGNREQTRIGCELHDGVAQTLGGLALRAKLLTQTLEQASHPGAVEAATFTRLLNQTIAEVRQLARGLAPVGLEVEGLPAALARLCLDTERAGNLPCPFTSNVPARRILPGVALHLFRLAQEAVANAMRHAEARQITVKLVQRGGVLSLTVQDDGKGFDLKQHGASGMGMSTLRYRAAAIGAQLTLRSRTGKGTTLRCVLSEIRLWRATISKEEPNDRPFKA